MIGVGVLTAANALTYSSGAVAIFVFGAVVAGLSRFVLERDSTEAMSLQSLGLIVTIVSGLCLVAHVVLPIYRFGINPVIETRQFSPSLPWEANFWHFYFGLFDRAVLSTRVDTFSLLRGMGVAAAVLVPLPLLLRLLRQRRFAAGKDREVVVLLAIVSSVACYAFLVTYGRAEFGGSYFPRIYSSEGFAGHYARSRFFYWWISAILPLTAIAWGLIVGKLHSTRGADWAVAALVVLALAPKAQNRDDLQFTYSGHWDFASRYQRDALKLEKLIDRDRLPYRVEAREVQLGENWAKLSTRERNTDFFPSDRVLFPAQHRYLYVSARRSDATFVDRWQLLE